MSRLDPRTRPRHFSRGKKSPFFNLKANECLLLNYYYFLYGFCKTFLTINFHITIVDAFSKYPPLKNTSAIRLLVFTTLVIGAFWTPWLASSMRLVSYIHLCMSKRRDKTARQEFNFRPRYIDRKKTIFWFLCKIYINIYWPQCRLKVNLYRAALKHW